jgi:hypothetical protein
MGVAWLAVGIRIARYKPPAPRRSKLHSRPPPLTTAPTLGCRCARRAVLVIAGVRGGACTTGSTLCSAGSTLRRSSSTLCSSGSTLWSAGSRRGSSDSRKDSERGKGVPLPAPRRSSDDSGAPGAGSAELVPRSSRGGTTQRD